MLKLSYSQMDQKQQRTEVQDQNKRPQQYSRQEIITDQTKMLLVETRRTGLALRDKVWWPGSKLVPGILYLLVSLACVILSTTVQAGPKMLLDDYITEDSNLCSASGLSLL